MAILSRVKISPHQRYDLEDFLAEQAAAKSDSKLWTKSLISDKNLILQGFSVSGIGLNSATVNMADAALMIPENSFDFSYFVSAPAEPNQIIPDSDLVDGTRNYVEIALYNLDGVPLPKALWDAEANSGLGAEFTQIVNTITDLRVEFVVSTGGFSGDPDQIPVAIIDVDGSGVIKSILDQRTMYGRLAIPSDLDNEYVWGSQIEPPYAAGLTAVSGTFTAGELITIGGETATVVTGGTTSITFNEPTGISFESGDTVTGLSSGATGTLDTVLESFGGADKSLKNQKLINDALMTEIKAMKETRFWFQASPTLSGLKREALSTISGIAANAIVKWDGSSLLITDSSLSPSPTDNIASIRMFASSANLYLQRQDDGKEVVTIDLDDVADSGSIVLNQDGNLITINWDDSVSDIQTEWDAEASEAATISGEPSVKKITITFDNPGNQVDITVDSNTLDRSGSSVSETLTIKNGMAADGSIALADGELLYVDLPDPLANTNYSEVGTGASNYKITTRGSALVTNSTYWLAYREGSRLIWRFSGELAAGESSEITDNIPQTLLNAIGLSNEHSLPNYTSNIRGVTEESLVNRVSTLTDAVGDSQEDRSAFFRSDDQVTWTGTELQFTTDIVLEILNTKSGTPKTATIESSESPIELADGEIAFIEINRSLSSEIVSIQIDTALPAQTQNSKDYFILAKRHDVSGDGYLFLPLSKQVFAPGQTSLLGASGSGSGTVVVDLYNPVSTVLPSGASATIDNVSVVNGDRVLFTNLVTDNNQIYEASGVGSSIVWSPINSFSGQVSPTDGDSVRVQRGDAFADQLAVFNGTNFLVNDTIRLFDGVSANFWELSSIKSSPISGSNITDDIFTVTAVGSENFIVNYSIFDGNSKETGQLIISANSIGNTAKVARLAAQIDVDVATTFEAIISGGDLILQATKSTVTSATMRYFVSRWSDSAGGPTGIPSYTPTGGSSVAAAGNPGEIQFHGGDGNLDASSNLAWDSAESALDLDGLLISSLSSPLTLVDNTLIATTIATIDSVHNFIIVEYSVARDTAREVGRILIASNGSSLSSTFDNTVLGTTGITLNVVQSGSDVLIQYTSSSTGDDGEFKYSVRKWS